MRNSELYLWNQISWDEEGEKLVENEDEVHQLATSIRNRFEKLPELSSKCCIYRIPRTLREAKKSAYSPCLISIGPFHHGKKRFKPMEDQKLRYLQNFLTRNDTKTLSDYLRFIRQSEKQTREYYVETINLDIDEFIELILLDAIFVIEFMLSWHFDDANETDRIFENPSVESVIRRDILLLENQIPFFVLNGLYNIAFGKPTNMPNFKELCSEMFLEHSNFTNREFLHLLDFVRTHYLPSKPRASNTVPFDFPPRIEMLYDTGIQFKVAKSSRLLDITFTNGVLTIPRLEVEDHTECLLRNLSAFEQCHYLYESYIVDYVVLMDVLITTQKDVDILMSNGIITNSLGTSQDLANVFNTICKGATYKNNKGFYYYYDLCKELNKYSKKPWNKWRATLNHDYFCNPWNIISVIVAIVLLIFTVIQTVCTVISMNK